MTWFKRKYPMQDFTFTFRGEDTLAIRGFEMRANLLEHAADEARRSLNGRYHEPHVLISYSYRETS